MFQAEVVLKDCHLKWKKILYNIFTAVGGKLLFFSLGPRLYTVEKVKMLENQCFCQSLTFLRA